MPVSSTATVACAPGSSAALGGAELQTGPRRSRATTPSMSASTPWTRAQTMALLAARRPEAQAPRPAVAPMPVPRIRGVGQQLGLRALRAPVPARGRWTRPVLGRRVAPATKTNGDAEGLIAVRRQRGRRSRSSLRRRASSGPVMGRAGRGGGGGRGGACAGPQRRAEARRGQRRPAERATRGLCDAPRLRVAPGRRGRRGSNATEQRLRGLDHQGVTSRCCGSFCASRDSRSGWGLGAPLVHRQRGGINVCVRPLDAAWDMASRSS
jgi:hypothetical protein